MICVTFASGYVNLSNRVESIEVFLEFAYK